MLMSYISLAPSSRVARPSIGPHQPSPRSWPAYQQAEFGSHTRLGNMLPIVFLNARCFLGLSLQDRIVGRKRLARPSASSRFRTLVASFSTGGDASCRCEDALVTAQMSGPAFLVTLSNWSAGSCSAAHLADSSVMASVVDTRNPTRVCPLRLRAR